MGSTNQLNYNSTHKCIETDELKSNIAKKQKQVIPKIFYRNNMPVPEGVKVGDKQLTFVNLNVESGQIAGFIIFGAYSFMESNVKYVTIEEAKKTTRKVQIVGEWVKEKESY